MNKGQVLPSSLKGTVQRVVMSNYEDNNQKKKKLWLIYKILKGNSHGNTAMTVVITIKKKKSSAFVW